MAEDRGHRELAHDPREFVVGLDMDEELDMPAHIANSRRHADEFVERVERHAAAIDEIDADAAHTAFMQAAQFGVGHVPANRRDRPQTIRGLRHRVDDRAIVRAVDARLDNDPASDSKCAMQREQSGRRRIGRRIGTLVLVGIAIGRTEDMDVAVASPGRHRKVRYARRRIRCGAKRRVRRDHVMSPRIANRSASQSAA